MLNRAGQIRMDESGQALVEYSLILLFVTTVTVATLRLIGLDLIAALTSVAADF
jgi:Flp pilus assembly pilin Flp